MLRCVCTHDIVYWNLSIPVYKNELVSPQIYFNQALHYGNGYTVTVTPSDKASWSVVSKNLIVVTHSQSVPEGTGIMVTVAPK